MPEERITKEQVIENIRNNVYGFGTEKVDNKRFQRDLKEIYTTSRVLSSLG